MKASQKVSSMKKLQICLWMLLGAGIWVACEEPPYPCGEGTYPCEGTVYYIDEVDDDPGDADDSN